MMSECPPEWWLSTDISSQPRTLRVKSSRHRHRSAFSSIERRSDFKKLPQGFATSVVHDTRRCADFFIGESRHILLQKIHKAAFTLKCGQQHQPGRVHTLRRIGGLRLQRRYFVCKLSADENAPRHLHPVPESNLLRHTLRR